MSMPTFMHEEIISISKDKNDRVEWTVQYWVTALDDPNDVRLGEWASVEEGQAGDPGVPDPKVIIDGF